MHAVNVNTEKVEQHSGRSYRGKRRIQKHSLFTSYAHLSNNADQGNDLPSSK